MSTPSLPLRCKCRRKAVTSLRCSRCNVPICPDCSTVAPVGMLCRECAHARRSPLVQVDPRDLALAYLACLGVASAAGLVLLWIGGGLGFFRFLLSYLYGQTVGETALKVTGRKRGLTMEILAGVCSGVGLVTGTALMALIHGMPVLDRVSIQLQTPFFYISMVIGIAGAVGRIRYI